MNKTNASQHENAPLKNNQWFGFLSQLDFDIEFFEELFSRDETSVEVTRVLAELVAKKAFSRERSRLTGMLSAFCRQMR